MNRNNNLWAVLLVLLGASSYGFGSSIYKLAIEDGWGSAHLTFTQVLAGAAMLWLVLGLRVLRRRHTGVTAGSGAASVRQSWLKLAIIGVVGLAMTTMFYNESLARIDASLAIVLLFQFTWITILLESIRRRAWPKRSEWLAIVVIAAGTVLAVGLLEHDFSQINSTGVMYGILSAITYSLFFFLTDFVSPELDSISKSSVMSTASLVFVTLIHFPTDFAWSDGFSIIGWGLLLGLVNTVIPFICFNAGIPRLGGGVAALLGSMELPAAVVTAFLLLGEPLTGWQASGILLILVGIWAAQNRTNEVVKAGQEGED